MAASALQREIDQALKGKGWRCEKDNKHVKYKGPNGELIVIPSSKTTSPRTIQNYKAHFKRAGIKF
jgi:predicted RNA binding protein YcfA (HicA-like mRNA interferase family)